MKLIVWSIAAASMAAALAGLPATASAQNRIQDRFQDRANDFAGRFGGFTLGVNAGAAWSQSNYATDPGCPNNPVLAVFCNASPDVSAVNGTAVAASGTGRFSNTGFTGGVQAGLNWQNGAFVFGAEGDFGAMHLRNSAAATGTFPLAFLGTRYTVTESLSTDWLATVRGRLGFAVAPHLLVYATGGAAFTKIELSGSYADNAIDATFPGGTGSGSTNRFRTGWTLGGGAQWALDRNWSLKAEYLYIDFGSVAVAVPTTNTSAYHQTMQVRSDLTAQLVRFGVDYRF